MVIKSITRHYGSNSKTVIYKKSLLFEPPRCKLHLVVSCQVCFQRGKHDTVLASSLQRTKTAIRDYIACNQFELFCTFTYDPSKVDSFDIEHSKRVMSKWLNNARRSSPNLAYIIVAELHPSSGRIHFHALLKGYNGALSPTRHRSKGRKVYNIPGWRYGFSTAVKIDSSSEDHAKVGNYVGKYVTKEMITLSNKRRYWASRNLKKPEKFYNQHRLIEAHPLFIKGVHSLGYLKIIDSALHVDAFHATVPIDTKEEEDIYHYHER